MKHVTCAADGAPHVLEIPHITFDDLDGQVSEIAARACDARERPHGEPALREHARDRRAHEP